MYLLIIPEFVLGSTLSYFDFAFFNEKKKKLPVIHHEVVAISLRLNYA